jgi:molybdopterin-guanine dinucleotide biosynthesis protein A
MTLTGDSRESAYVLAGGGSTRFGQDKALAKIAGRPMILRMRDLLQESGFAVNVVADPQKYTHLGIAALPDTWPGEGPLGGIVTALHHSEIAEPPREWNLVVSCDMPFLTADWLRFLAARAQKSTAQVVLPQSDYSLEPLCACYHIGAKNALHQAFEAGVRRVTQALKQVPTEVLDAADWKRFDSSGSLFWNMNTAADYNEAVRRSEAHRGD